MSPATLVIVLLALSSLAYYVGRRRAVTVGGDKIQIKQLHSRPTYYGALTAIWCGIPALLIFGFWLAFDSNVITQLVVADLPENIRNLSDARLNLIVNDIRNLVSGNIVSGEVDPAMQAAADHYRSLKTTSNAALAVVSISTAMLAMVFVRRKIKPGLRARNLVERVIKVHLNCLLHHRHLYHHRHCPVGVI
jgi:phosphate transport system permease protein